MQQTTTRIPGYNLARPDARLARTQLAAALGDAAAEVCWSQVCDQLGLDPAAEHDVQTLARIADRLAEAGGVTAVLGRSLAIRISTWTALHARSGDPLALNLPNDDPVMDPERLAAIERHRLLTDGQASFADVVAEAAERLDVPVALLSVVLDSAQVFAAAHGLEGWLAEVRGTPAEWSFCTNAVHSGHPFVVEDASSHPLLMDNPLVAIEGFRSYAGVPLEDGEGLVLGTLCVLGKEPRRFDELDLQVLRDLVEEIRSRLEG
jgi:GAF domain-containing protein